MRSIFALFLSVLLLSLSACNNEFTKVQKSKDPYYKLQKADEYYAKKKYKNAQTLYESLFPVLKGSDKFEELYYKYAYTFYNDKMYADAENMFKGYLEVFPNSPKAEEVSFMRAMSFYKQSPKLELDQTNTNKAISMMLTFINNFPNSTRVKEATDIINEGRLKLESKDFKTAELYYNLGNYRASAIAYGDLMFKYPETVKADEYKLKAIKAYFKYAELSMRSKQVERYQKVIEEYQDFQDRFPESKYLKEAEGISESSTKKIKEIENEQTSQAA